MILLSAATLACDGAPVTRNSGPDDLGTTSCAAPTSWTTYYVDALHAATADEATMGDVVGFDIDGVRDACGVPDWPNSVDNSFIDFAAALAILSPGANVQRALDDALCASPDGAPAVALRVRVSEPDGCGRPRVELQDASGTPVGVSTFATLESGVLRASVTGLDLTVPWSSHVGGVSGELALEIGNVRLEATVEPSGLSDLVIGGGLPGASFTSALQDLVAAFNSPTCGSPGEPECVPLSTITDTLDPLFDLSNDQGMCGVAGALSIGLTGSASTDPTPPTCQAR